jgi:hypothetical protein
MGRRARDERRRVSAEHGELVQSAVGSALSCYSLKVTASKGSCQGRVSRWGVRGYAIVLLVLTAVRFGLSDTTPLPTPSPRAPRAVPLAEFGIVDAPRVGAEFDGARPR